MSKKIIKAKSTRDKQRPEALAQFAQSAREENSGNVDKKLNADRHTAPIPADNADKHDVATEILNEGAHGSKPDPKDAGADKLPDRIIKSRD